MAFVGVRLLPKVEADTTEEDNRDKEFVTELIVGPDSPLNNRTLDEADFRGTYDLQLLELIGRERNNCRIKTPFYARATCCWLRVSWIKF